MKKKTSASARPKMVWKKPEPEMVERFNAALPIHPAAQPKKMFGYPACFVNGNFFVGMYSERSVVTRLPGDLKGKFPELARAEVFDPMGTGKGMKDWWVVPPAITGDAARLTQFFTAAFAEVQQLPPKVKKPKTKPLTTKTTNRKKN